MESLCESSYLQYKVTAKFYVGFFFKSESDHVVDQKWVCVSLSIESALS